MLDGTQLMSRLQMTGQIEEQVRVQIEHKKLLLEQYKETGKKPDELEQVIEDISKLQELLREIEEKSRKSDQPFEYPRRDR